MAIQKKRIWHESRWLVKHMNKNSQNQPMAANQNPPITAMRNAKPRWYIFPDELPNGEFRGFENRKDRTVVRGAFVLGQNVSLRDAGLPNLREGYDPVGTENSDITPVYRAWVFETRGGDVFEIKSYNGKLYFWLLGTSTDWLLLKGGFTVNLEFGFGNIGESSAEFHTFFNNGVDPWYEFNGAYAIVQSFTANTITMSEAGTFASRNFYTTGSITVAGAERTYSGGSGSATLTGVSSTAGISVGDIIVQTPRQPTFRIFFPFKTIATGTFVVGETVTGSTSSQTATIQRVAPDSTYIVITGASGAFTPGELLTGGTSAATANLVASLDQTLGPPLSSVMIAHASRLHCRDEAKKSVWAYSMLDDPYTWSVFGEDTSGGRKDIEFSGAITAFGKLNQTVLGYKRRGITSLGFVQTGQRTDVPVYAPLIQSDDKSTTLGAIGQRSTFSSPYGMVSITIDSKMILISGITNNNQPNYSILSDPIQPVFNGGVHTDASGVCVDGVLWYSFKSSNTVGANETVLVGDLRRKTVDAYGNSIPLRWDVPYIGWQVKDWTAVPSDTGGTKIHWHSSLSSNTFVVTPTSKEDDGGSFGATIRTWLEMFGVPEIRKKADKAFVEIRMRENSQITADLLFDEEGFTDTVTKIMLGTDVNKRFGSTPFNPIGSSVFGGQKIGSNGEVDERALYRFYFEFKPTFWFFNLALQLSTQIENSDFELVRFGVRIIDLEVNPPKAYAI